jgi:formylmethanofuran dehydrogenase subunit B
VCACVCDDLKITVQDGKVVSAERACQLAEPWYREPWLQSGTKVQIRGTPVLFDQAVSRSADILRDARAPLIYGLSQSSTEGQRAAVALADRLGAIIDTTASEGHAPSILAMQQAGESTCSLGEIRNRSDLVIYWGANPVVSHPRHMERYSLDATGLMIPHGRSDRFLVVVDSQLTETAQQADLFIQVEDGCDFDVLWTLRGLLKGLEPTPDRSVGADLQRLHELADRMKACRSGVIFFGYGVARQPLGHRNVEALLRLVTDLNGITRFYARRLRVVGDVSGADSVLCWQTGYPFSVSLSRGYPRYGPGEYSAADVLANGEADALVLIGTSRMETFSAEAIQHMRRIPTIVLERANVSMPLEPTVQFVTATYGIHRPGVAYRMDEVPIRLRPILDSDLPSDGEVLRAIHAAL